MGESRGVYRVLWENLRERDHLGDPGIDGRTTVRWIFSKLDMRAWNRSIWLRIGTDGGHLCLRKLTFEFHKMRRIS
jgi:hypothetical protein